jgi:hypothetical protein
VSRLPIPSALDVDAECEVLVGVETRVWPEARESHERRNMAAVIGAFCVLGLGSVEDGKGCFGSQVAGSRASVASEDDDFLVESIVVPGLPSVGPLRAASLPDVLTMVCWPEGLNMPPPAPPLAPVIGARVASRAFLASWNELGVGTTDGVGFGIGVDDAFEEADAKGVGEVDSGRDETAVRRPFDSGVGRVFAADPSGLGAKLDAAGDDKLAGTEVTGSWFGTLSSTIVIGIRLRLGLGLGVENDGDDAGFGAGPLDEPAKGTIGTSMGFCRRQIAIRTPTTATKTRSGTNLTKSRFRSILHTFELCQLGRHGRI